MNCLCCYEEYEGNRCPVCGFEDVQIIGDNREEALKKIQPMIDAYRVKFLGEHEIGVALMKRKDISSSEITAVPEKLSFGKVQNLIGKDTWLGRSIVAYPDAKKDITVEAVVSHASRERYESASIPGMENAGVIDVGVHVNNDYSFSILISTNGKTIGRSQPIKIRKG